MTTSVCVLMVAVALGAAGCAKKPSREEGREETVGAQQADVTKLKSAAAGTWAAPWGQLRFDASGTAKFSLRTHCVENQDNLEPVRLKEGCLAEEWTGKLEIEPYRFVLRVGEEGRVFDVFLDADGKLHLDVLLAERVVPVDERGRGKIQLGMFKAILVADKCSLVDEFKEPLEIPCDFERTPTPALFRFRVPEGTSTFQETPDRTMVYLQRERLLVPPSIYKMAFERVAD